MPVRLTPRKPLVQSLEMSARYRDRMMSFSNASCGASVSLRTAISGRERT
jgi:hypothetical protein